MNTTSATESRNSPAPGIIPEPPLVHEGPATPTRRSADATGRRPTRRTPLARLLAALHGDKYMVDAYAPVDSSTKEV
jgi:hypothetical protein